MPEYRRGMFLIRAQKDKIDRLVKQDEKAREIYSGFEEQVERLKKLIERLKERKRNENGDHQDHEQGEEAPRPDS